MVKVKSIKYDWLSATEGKPHKVTQDCKIILSASIDQKPCNIYITIMAGFKTDGLSVPRIFRWFLPSWEPYNPIYNLAGIIHDWLYSVKGNCIFDRSECDDIFRGILRESGLGRFKAGMADWCVGMFAGNERHWGNDSLNVARYGRMELRMKNG